MESGFSLIIANFRRGRLDEVEKKLERMGVERLNVSKVKGFGEYHNYFAHNWLEDEVRVEIFTKTHRVDSIVSAIMDAACTQCAGDGVVAVMPIHKLYLIRGRSEATPETFWRRAGAEPSAAPTGYAGRRL